MTETGFDLTWDWTNLNETNNPQIAPDGQVMIWDLNGQDPSLNYQSNEFSQFNEDLETNSNIQNDIQNEIQPDLSTTNWNIDFSEETTPTENFNSWIDFSDNQEISWFENQTSIDSNIFSESTTNEPILTQVDWNENYGKFLRLFFFSSLFMIIWIALIVIEYSFNLYINKASEINIDPNYKEYVDQYKTYLKKWKELLNIDSKNYTTPNINSNSLDNFKKDVNSIITSKEIDFIEKKDLIKPAAENLKTEVFSKTEEIGKIRTETAIQWFLPDEIKTILKDKWWIDTIQRSLNALEIIKFSTATRVFSYMNTALETITYMVWRNGVDRNTISSLLNQIISRWENDISSYVYLCYLNPYETDSNCNIIWDFDLYYNLNSQDTTLNLDLFKRTMNAINQLLENEDTAMFSITFNWFNAKSENITFNIEVFTNQSDEKALISQWKRNPNIFILTNIINLLKQSSFIIWADIDTKEINVEQQEVNVGWLTTTVNYSTKTFTLPIQKNTEREIFDYIDLPNILKILNKAENTTNNQAKNTTSQNNKTKENEINKNLEKANTSK